MKGSDLKASAAAVTETSPIHFSFKVCKQEKEVRLFYTLISLNCTAIKIQGRVC